MPGVYSRQVERFVALAAEGKTRQEAAQIIGCGMATVYNLAKKNGINFRHPSRAASGRAEQMASMHRQGLTLEKIGQHFSLTRERVRQVLAQIGITGKDGGQAKQATVRREKHQRSVRARAELMYGIPYEVLLPLRKDGVTTAFQSQRQSAAIRGIDWELDFASWLAVWQASGKLHLRGRGKGRYVMSRIRDDGGYELGNVHIQLATENSREAVAKWRGKVKKNPGVFCLFPGRELAWLAKVCGVRLGFYPTEESAAAARAEYLAEHPEVTQKAKGRGYAHIKSTCGGKDRFQVMVNRKYVGTFHSADAALTARAAFIAAQSSNRSTDANAVKAG